MQQNKYEQNNLAILNKLQVSTHPQNNKNKKKNPHLTLIPKLQINTIYQFYFQLSDPSYHTHSKLLIHTTIKPQDRQKLKSWLLHQTQNIYQRETYTTASKFLDMYFNHLQKIPKNKFQILGIACLILAAKVIERRIPNISFKIFNKNQIFALERKLLTLFNFKVWPVTYIAIAHQVFYFWDNWHSWQNQPFQHIKYFQENINSIKRTRTVLETLDCMDLVPQTLDIPLENLVTSVFIIQNRKFCLLSYSNENKYNKISVIQSNENHPFDDLYQNLIRKFLKSLKHSLPTFSTIKIDQKTLLYTLYFSRINPKINLKMKYSNFRIQLSKQTYNSEITKLAQNYINSC